MKAWITYTYKDKTLAEKLTKILIESQIEVLDNVNEIMPGDNIIESIYNTISSADIIFIIFSKNSNERIWFNTEIGMIVSEIRSNPQKKIIPVLTDNQIKIPPFIDQYQCFVLENEEDIKVKFVQLIDFLKKRVNKPYSNREIEIISHNLNISKKKLLEKEEEAYEKAQKQKYEILLLTILTTYSTPHF